MERASTLVLSVVCLACLSYGLLGCDSGDRNVSSKGDTTQQPASTAGDNGLANQGTTPEGSTGGPMSGGGMPGGAMSGQMPPNVKPVKDAQAAYDKAKKAFASNPSDAKAKEAFVNAANDLGDANMFSNDLSPKVKYPSALKYYREAAKADPTNAKAKGNIDLLLGIYKSMGKTPPAEGG